MARIVELRDRLPLIVEKKDVPADGLRICRCGLSDNWPYCDDSHKSTKGEAPGKLYRYMRKVPSDELVRAELQFLPEGERPTTAESKPRQNSQPNPADFI